MSGKQSITILEHLVDHLVSVYLPLCQNPPRKKKRKTSISNSVPLSLVHSLAKTVDVLSIVLLHVPLQTWHKEKAQSLLWTLWSNVCLGLMDAAATLVRHLYAQLCTVVVVMLYYICAYVTFSRIKSLYFYFRCAYSQFLSGSTCLAVSYIIALQILSRIKYLLLVEGLLFSLWFGKMTSNLTHNVGLELKLTLTMRWLIILW